MIPFALVQDRGGSALTETKNKSGLIVSLGFKVTASGDYPETQLIGQLYYLPQVASLYRFKVARFTVSSHWRGSGMQFSFKQVWPIASDYILLQPRAAGKYNLQMSRWVPMFSTKTNGKGEGEREKG